MASRRSEDHLHINPAAAEAHNADVQRPRARAQANAQKRNDTAKSRGNGSHNEDHEGKNQNRGIGVFLRSWLGIALISVVILAIVIGGIIWWLNARQYEDTDDAFIDTHIVQISSQVAGQILAIHVNDNQAVTKGDPLVDLDPAPERDQLAQVEAQRIQAQSQIAQAQANERAAQAQLINASRDLARYNTLRRTTPLAVAQQQVDQAQAAQRNALAQRDSANAQITAAKDQIKVFDAQIATAKLNLGYTHIVAPISGHIAQRNVAIGNYVTPGQELMALVPLQVWVTANFKETQLHAIRPGQPVTVTVDSCDRTVDAHIDSIQRGAGQAFGILPPENATGNFVKVVQRVPVKIVLDRIPRGCILGPGMSVEPSVKVR